MASEGCLDGGTGRSPVPTAQPGPAWLSLESAVEQGSGCPQSGPPRPPQWLPSPTPGAAALLLWKLGNRNRGPFCMPQEAVAAPSWPEPPSLPQPQAQGVRGGGPSPMCMHLCQERLCGQETQPVGPDGWAVLRSATVGSTMAWLRPARAQKEEPAPGATALPPWPPGAGLPLSRAWPASLLPGPLQALAIRSFPLHGPLLPSHIQVLGSAKQVQATEQPQRGL